MRSLRGRLLASHLLPILLLLPLVGITLIYILETQVLLTGISEELAQQGALTADMAGDQPAIWSDSGEAQRFVSYFGVRSRTHIMLFDANGTLLASSDPAYHDHLGQTMDMPRLKDALSGDQQVQVNYTQNEFVQVLVPVKGPNQEIMGVVRMSQYVSDVQHQLDRLRTLILFVLAAALVLGGIVGLILALNLGRSLRQVTDAIDSVTVGQQWQTLPEQGPEEIRTLLRAFNALTERLRLLEESRRKLLANLVHELGRPLGALQSATQALLDGAEEDVALRRELLEGMDSQVRRLGPLLDSLTDLHGQVLGTLELNRQPVDMGPWLQRILPPWREAAQEKGLDWHVELPAELPVLNIDPDRMAQALGNILSNAVKYTTKGEVQVQAETSPTQTRITVRDTGIGIAAEEQELVFRPYYRSERNTRFPQGMGLGLGIARDLVTAHGGRLELESTAGKGSQFTISLPVE